MQDRWSSATDLFKEDLGGKFLTGVFVDRDAPEFVSEYYQMAERIRSGGRSGKRRTKKG